MSTPTPALTRRVVVAGVAVMTLVLLAVNAGVYIALRSSLLQSVDDLLAERAETVRIEQRDTPPGASQAQELARRLQARGLRVVVRAPDGNVFRADPSSPVVSGELPPPGPGALVFKARQISLPNGLTAEVFARTSGVTRTLRNLLALQVIASLGAIGGAALLFSRASSFALRPVRDIAGAAARTAAGQRGERLRPDRPETELGQMATAYDRMLDSLEEGMVVAANLERRSGTLEARWRQVLEAAQEAYVAVNAAGEIVDWNLMAEELFGWSRDDVLGKSVTLLVPERLREIVVRTISETAAIGPGALGAPYEMRGLTRDGREFAAEGTVWGIDRRGGTVVHSFIRDVTERREFEQSSARLVAVVEGSSDAIITQGLDGVIQTWNAAAENSYGWSAAEAVGQHVALIVPPEELPEHAERLLRIGQDQPVARYEGECLTRGGIRVPVSVRLSPVHDATGEVVAASSIARDITEERFLAGTLDNTLTALGQAVEEAKSSEERTREFLADAAHQLRTPMAGIRACAETLLRGVPPEAADELLASMVRETSRAARLVTSLLQMARLDQGQTLVLEPCDVVAVCQDEVDRARVLAPHLTVRLDADEIERQQLDPKALHEILANLVDNARRHAATEVSVRVEASNGGVRICVRDDGPGVPPDQEDRIFQRFVSLDGRGGSGLGLPIARGYARAMGGELSCSEGFVLTFPLTGVA